MLRLNMVLSESGNSSKVLLIVVKPLSRQFLNMAKMPLSFSIAPAALRIQCAMMGQVHLGEWSNQLLQFSSEAIKHLYFNCLQVLYTCIISAIITLVCIIMWDSSYQPCTARIVVTSDLRASWVQWVIILITTMFTSNNRYSPRTVLRGAKGYPPP